ncbi:MAG: hypothetical protein WBZ36_08840 [Candidatus Nitrosopolaris sp.]
MRTPTHKTILSDVVLMNISFLSLSIHIMAFYLFPLLDIYKTLERTSTNSSHGRDHPRKSRDRKDGFKSSRLSSYRQLGGSLSIWVNFPNSRDVVAYYEGIPKGNH